MEREKVFEFLQATVQNLFHFDETFSEELSLTNDVGLDSLEFVELIMMSEKEFGLLIADEIAFRIDTIGDLIDAVCEA